MSAPVTPYTNDLAGRDPLIAIADTIERVRALARAWSADRFERSYAPGKWSARQLLIHLAQIEMGLGCRMRLALTTADYVAQPWDQDRWMGIETHLDGRDALDAFAALARMNLVFFKGLTPAQRATSFSHPEYGSLTVDWIIHHLAGHQLHHLAQLDRIA